MKINIIMSIIKIIAYVLNHFDLSLIDKLCLDRYLKKSIDSKCNENKKNAINKNTYRNLFSIMIVKYRQARYTGIIIISNLLKFFIFILYE